VHDDVIDAADTRRGRASANRRWGNSMTVLAGDWLYMESFRLALAERKLRVLDVLTELTQMMVEGELIQLEQLGRLRVSEAEALDISRRKTACLFSACLRLGALLGGLLAEHPDGEIFRSLFRKPSSVATAAELHALHFGALGFALWVIARLSPRARLAAALGLGPLAVLLVGTHKSGVLLLPPLALLAWRATAPRSLAGTPRPASPTTSGGAASRRTWRASRSSAARACSCCAAIRHTRRSRDTRRRSRRSAAHFCSSWRRPRGG
jgi:hypothetical protein